MFGIRYFKGQPNDYIFRYSGGRVRSEGLGAAFFYFEYNTQITAVPTGSIDSPFIFSALTADFQEVSIQGQLTYRIKDPKKAGELLNFRIDPFTYSYISTDRDMLGKRAANAVQIETRAEVEKRPLEQTIRDSRAIATTVFERAREANSLSAMGVELLSVDFLAVKPTPEVSKALEAEYRESLLRKADEAIYARRAASVDEERKIKEKELASDMAIEQQRKELVVLQGSNMLQEAENRGTALEREAGFKAKAAEMEMAVLRTLDPRTLLALAMRDFGQNAQNIGNLTITSEILAGLLEVTRKGE